MDARLEGYVIRQFAQLLNERKQDFLRTLKYKPDIVTRIITDNFNAWSLLAVFESRDPIGQVGGGLFIYDCQQTCSELTECLKQHFAKEMEAIQPAEKSEESRLMCIDKVSVCKPTGGPECAGCGG